MTFGTGGREQSATWSCLGGPRLILSPSGPISNLPGTPPLHWQPQPICLPPPDLSLAAPRLAFPPSGAPCATLPRAVLALDHLWHQYSLCEERSGQYVGLSLTCSDALTLYPVSRVGGEEVVGWLWCQCRRLRFCTRARQKSLRLPRHGYMPRGFSVRSMEMATPTRAHARYSHVTAPPPVKRAAQSSRPLTPHQLANDDQRRQENDRSCTQGGCLWRRHPDQGERAQSRPPISAIKSTDGALI